MKNNPSHSQEELEKFIRSWNSTDRTADVVAEMAWPYKEVVRIRNYLKRHDVILNPHKRGPIPSSSSGLAAGLDVKALKAVAEEKS